MDTHSTPRVFDDISRYIWNTKYRYTDPGGNRDDTIEDTWHRIAETLAETFVCAHELAPEVHLRMQATIQEHVDNSISKTINIPEDYDFSEFQSVYESAYKLDLKSCTVFRPNPVTREVLHARKEPVEREHCCNINF